MQDFLHQQHGVFTWLRDSGASLADLVYGVYGVHRVYRVYEVVAFSRIWRDNRVDEVAWV